MTEKKRFEKAMSQLDSAFQKAKEVKEVKAPEFKAPEFRAPEVEAPEVEAPEFKAPEVKANEVKSSTVGISAKNKNPTREISATRRATLDRLLEKQKQDRESKLKTPNKNRSPITTTKPKALKSEAPEILKKQPNLEIKKVPHLKKPFQRVQNFSETNKDTYKKETVPFDNSFDAAIEKLARKKQQNPDPKTAGIKTVELKEAQKTEPKKEVEILPHGTIDDKKSQQTLENSLYLALHKILQKQTPPDSSLPEEFYKDSKMVLKNRTFLKEKFSHFSDVKIDFYVQLGEMDIVLGDLLNFKEGTILETEIAPSTKPNCYANKQLLGQGELSFEGYSTEFRLQKFFK